MNYNSWLSCVAPTVLGFPVVTVPNPSGLGYVVSRLRRSGFVPVVLEFSGCNSRLLICNAAPEARKTVAQCGSAGYMKRQMPSAVGAAEASDGQSYDPHGFADCHTDIEATTS